VNENDFSREKNHELRDFVLTFFKILLRYALLGVLTGTLLGLAMAGLATAFGAGGEMTNDRFLAIVANYALFGALLGGIAGIVAGLLTQRH
jgi:hypothetical protein